MASDPGPYRREVARAEAKFRLAMAAGKADAFDLALLRVTWQIMLTELTTAPNSVLVWERMGPDPRGFTGAERWALASLEKALGQIRPTYGSPEQYSRKFEEYLDLA